MRFDHFSAALIFGAALVSGTQNMVTFDPTTSWGTWQGFGTSLSWWANIYGDRDDLADIFFTLNNVTYHSKDPSVQQKTLILPGLGLNIARYNLGGKYKKFNLSCYFGQDINCVLHNNYSIH